MKYKCVVTERLFSPKAEDNVTRYSFMAKESPQGKHQDVFVENVTVWLQDSGAFQVGKEYEFDVRVAAFGANLCAECGV